MSCLSVTCSLTVSSCQPLSPRTASFKFRANYNVVHSKLVTCQTLRTAAAVIVAAPHISSTPVILIPQHSVDRLNVTTNNYVTRRPLSKNRNFVCTGVAYCNVCSCQVLTDCSQYTTGSSKTCICNQWLRSSIYSLCGHSSNVVLCQW